MTDDARAIGTRSSNLNLPNTITIVRILLAPVFLWLLFADGGADGGLRWAATALFVLAIATDGIDGHIARSRNQVTDLGKLLDPIADKVLTGAALIIAGASGRAAARSINLAVGLLFVVFGVAGFLVRDTEANRERFAAITATVLGEYLAEHAGIRLDAAPSPSRARLP